MKTSRRPRNGMTLAQLCALRHWSADEARWVVETWKASGLSMAAFADKHGLKAKRISWWRRRLRAETSEPPDIAFLPVKINQPATAPADPLVRQHGTAERGPEETLQASGSTTGTGALEVVTPAGHVVRVFPGFAPPTLQRLLLALEDLPC